jgi:hypothetical protein
MLRRPSIFLRQVCFPMVLFNYVVYAFPRQVTAIVICGLASFMRFPVERQCCIGFQQPGPGP